MRLPFVGHTSHPLPFVTVVLSVLLLAGCASAPRHAAAPHPDPLLLVSIDGLRAADVAAMPTLSKLAADGVRAESMQSSYPSLTFPNHYTLVTGLRPDRHGIVNNTMRDPELGDFSLSNREAVADGRWWDGGEPVWVGAKKAGLRSATMFWPGSEAEIRGVRPDDWRPFDADVAPRQRVEQVLAWLDRPPAQRPDLITLYFDQVDHEEHLHGPDSTEADQSRALIDDALAQLLAGLEARGLRARLNLIVVSDHGMAAVPPGHAIAVEDIAPPDLAEVIGMGQVVGLQPRAGSESAFEAALDEGVLGRHAHHECWRKADLPARWHYGANPRIPAVVCQTDEGWNAAPRAVIAKYRDNEGTRGSHGYDPALASMQAMFVADGPAFRDGVVLPRFDNVDVYPLLARLLGIAPAPNDGDIAPLLPALKDAGE
ncbi:MAG: ectonucleotide pyrophosphatase/phosphodiesterase [Pseudoxanthomonas sp.]